MSQFARRLGRVEPHNVQFTQAASNAFDGLPDDAKTEFARHVYLVLQQIPDRGTAAYPVERSRTTPGLFHILFGTAIASYSIDPATRLVRVSDFTY